MSRGWGRRGFARLALCALVVAAGGAVLPSRPAAAAWSAPAFVNTVGGNGHAGMYPWGLAYNPVDGKLVVGDYLNYQLRRYDTDGNALNDFYRTNQTGQPYSVAVDPNNGDIMVGEIADGSIGGNISRYDKDGNYLYTVNVSADYYAWITIGADGYLYVADSHYWNGNSSGDVSRVRKYAVSASGASQVSNFRIRKSSSSYFTQTPLCYGIAVDSAGNVYLPDNGNQVIHKFSNSGTWLGDFGSGDLGADIRSIAIDNANGWLYTSDAQQHQIEKYSLAGTHLGTFASTGSGDGQTQGGFRQLSVDGAGNVWAADYGGFRVQQFDSDGNWIKAIPDPDRLPGDGMMAQPRDVDVNPVTGDVWAVDTWNQRVQRFTSNGTFAGQWGHRGSDPPYGFNYPRGIAVDPTTQNVWVSSERGHYIRVFDATMTTALFTVGTEGVDSDAAGFLRWPNDVEFHAGKAYVSDRVSGKVKWFDSTSGAELGYISRNNWGIALDAASGNVYVSDPGTDKIYKYSASGSLITSWGSSGSGNGQFRDAKDLTVVGSSVYVTDDSLSRVQVFDLDGNYLGKWGGRGSGPNQFANPAGISHDSAGRIYVADSANDRVVVYDTTQARPLYENTKPTLTVTSPADNQQFCCQPTFTGTAADNLAVANVEYSVQDTGTSAYWNAANSTWQATQTWGLAPVAGPQTSKTFSFKFLGGTYGHTYTATIRARDISSNVSTTQTRTFTITENPQAPDTTPPETAYTTPVANQTYPLGQMELGGTATDDRGVTTTQVAIKSTALNQWWNGSGWQASFKWVDATVTSPGATSTTWTYQWTPPAVGTYGFMARAGDAAGNRDSSNPYITFTVNDSGQGDTTPPDATVTSPTNNAVLAAGALTFTGNATDNVGVAGVDVMIKNRANNTYWKASTGTWVSTFTWNTDSVLDSPGATATGWTYGTTLAPGIYAISVRARDAIPNYDATRPWINFTVS